MYCEAEGDSSEEFIIAGPACDIAGTMYENFAILCRRDRAVRPILLAHRGSLYRREQSLFVAIRHLVLLYKQVVTNLKFENTIKITRSEFRFRSVTLYLNICTV